jgi:hypothetical protein
MNPDAVRLAAQLLGVPPCPECDYVMRPGHACEAMRVQTAKPLRPLAKEKPEP